MARYKATVIFEVHEDEEKDGIIGDITEYVQEIGDLLSIIWLTVCMRILGRERETRTINSKRHIR
jgi:hypothetical protein